jgi:hypothetical protein
MGIFIGITIIVALVIGFMYANDISERKSFEDVRKELGEKMINDEEK